MSEINRVALFGKLNELAYKGIESATVFCKMRGNPYVEGIKPPTNKKWTVLAVKLLENNKLREKKKGKRELRICLN